MKHVQFYRTILDSYLKGDSTTLAGLLFYLIFDARIPVWKLAQISDRVLGVNEDVFYSTIQSMGIGV